jgi:hypothetical protein
MRPALFSLPALLAPLVFSVLLIAPAAAQPVQPLDRLLPEIRRTHPGRFYDADGPHPGVGGPHYHLKWMTPDGRIIWYDTDARTGRVLGSSPGRDNFDPREHFGGYGGPPAEGPRGRFREEPGAGEYGGGYGAWSGGRGYGARGGYGGRGFGGGRSRGGGGGRRGH